MVWSKQYETGNEQVDNEHKEIFRLVKKILDDSFESREEKIDTAIKFMADYIINHFRGEEALMLESDYPAMEEHKKLHADFIDVILDLIERVINETDNLKNHLDVNNIIVSWFISHVLDKDKAMIDHYRKWTAERK